MEIYRTETKLVLGQTEKLEEGDWRPLSKLELDGGMILTRITDEEHDKILNIHDLGDPDGLRGIMATLHVEKGGSDDPSMINLALPPQKGQVIRHQDKYYLILRVIQSTSFSVAILAKRVAQSELWNLPASV